MEWTNDMIIEFLQIYETEPILWNPKHPDRRERRLITNAWRRICKTLIYPCTVTEIKKKRDSLMAYYRSHMRKLRKMRTPTTKDDYKMSWFAYDTMHSFLGNIYDASVSSSSCTRDKNINQERESTDSMNESEYQSDSEYKPNIECSTQEMELSEEQCTKSNPETLINECEMYGKLLVFKLMKLDEDDRLLLMNKIDNLVYETTMKVKTKKETDTLADASSSSSTNMISCNNRQSIQADTPRLISNGNLAQHSHSYYVESTVGNDCETTESECDNIEIKEEF